MMRIRKNRRLSLENLERRELMAAEVISSDQLFEPRPASIGDAVYLGQPAQPATIYLDFGFGYANGELAEVPSAYMGAGAPFDGADRRNPSDPHHISGIRSLQHWVDTYAIDYNQDSTVDHADALALADDVLALVRRSYEPFNVNVEIANVSSWDDIAALMTSSDRKDTLVIMGGRADGTFLGVANLPDIQSRQNNRDDVVYVVARGAQEDLPEHLFGIDGPRRGVFGSVAKNSDDLYHFATGLARVATHEAAHSLGLMHIHDGDGVEAGDLMDTDAPDKLFSIGRKITDPFAVVLGSSTLGAVYHR
jgi:hypothetical protein